MNKVRQFLCQFFWRHNWRHYRYEADKMVVYCINCDKILNKYPLMKQNT